MFVRSIKEICWFQSCYFWHSSYNNLYSCYHLIHACHHHCWFLHRMMTFLIPPTKLSLAQLFFQTRETAISEHNTLPSIQRSWTRPVLRVMRRLCLLYEALQVATNVSSSCCFIASWEQNSSQTVCHSCVFRKLNHYLFFLTYTVAQCRFRVSGTEDETVSISQHVSDHRTPCRTPPVFALGSPTAGLHATHVPTGCFALNTWLMFSLMFPTSISDSSQLPALTCQKCCCSVCVSL